MPKSKSKCKSVACKTNDNCHANPIWTKKNCKAGTETKCAPSLKECKTDDTCDDNVCKVPSKSISKICKSVSCKTNDNCNANPIWTKKNCKKGTSGKCSQPGLKTCSKHKTCDENKCKVPDKKSKCKSIACDYGNDCYANPIWTKKNCKTGTTHKCNNQ